MSEDVEAREEGSCEEEAGGGGRPSALAGGDRPLARAHREAGSEQGRPSSMRMCVCARSWMTARGGNEGEWGIVRERVGEA